MQTTNRNNKKIKYMILMLVLMIVTVFSTSYAVLTKTLVGEKTYKLTIGTLDFEIQNESNAIRLMNAYPMADSVGQTLTPYTFTVTNTGTISEYFRVSLIEDEEQKTACSGCEFLNPSKLRYQVTIDGVAGNIGNLSSTTVLDSGELIKGQSKNYELRIWMDSTATIEEENKYYFGRIKVDASQEEIKDSTVSTASFETLGENCKTYDDGTDTFLVGQCSNNYVWYSGKLWRVVLKNNATGAVKMVTDNAITAIGYNEFENPTFENSYMDQWLDQEFLPTLHDYEDYLVVDSVWDTTEDSSSTPARPVGTTTVTRAVGLLNAYEYYTTYTNSDGLATYETGYLNNEVYWWLMTPYDSSSVRIVANDGTLNVRDPGDHAYGARPSINLKSTIQIESGTGIQSDPYILKGDIQGTTNGTTLLSTRYSGEYITFNNELYRIVDKETVNGEILTKITAVDKPSSLVDNLFDSDEVISFAEAEIKTDLEDYYQNLATTNATAYNMIQPNTIWYLGSVGDIWSQTPHYYKDSICASIDATQSMNACTEKAASTTASIGLTRAGEMFTSQITRGTKADFWTLTPHGPTDIYVHVVGSDGSLGGDGANYYGYGARPSMYLKSTVRIASINTGNGTYEYPYSIELGE